MSRAALRPGRPLRGAVSIPGDKSITQRAILLAALAQGVTRVRNPNPGADAAAAAGIVKALGAVVRRERDGTLVIAGGALRESERVLDARNSGTALRLATGLLAAQPFLSILTGDASLRRRPVARLLRPLRAFGAEVTARAEGTLPPVVVNGRALHAAEIDTGVASAQVKSALLLAAIQAPGDSIVHEAVATRDHTERMLPLFGVPVAREGRAVRVTGGAPLRAAEIDVPGDPSAATFLAAAATITPGSDVTLSDVGVNPTRRAFFDLLAASGANLTYDAERVVSGEPVANVRVRAAGLRPFRVSPDQAPALIDELPLVAVLAALTRGRSEIRGAGELRVKESDRIETVAAGLRAVGGAVEPLDDGWIIEGKGRVPGGRVASAGDHRIAMAFLVAGLRATGGVTVDDAACVAVSDPDFLSRLRKLAR